MAERGRNWNRAGLFGALSSGVLAMAFVTGAAAQSRFHLFDISQLVTWSNPIARWHRAEPNRYYEYMAFSSVWADRVLLSAAIFEPTENREFFWHVRYLALEDPDGSKLPDWVRVPTEVDRDVEVIRIGWPWRWLVVRRERTMPHASDGRVTRGPPTNEQCFVRLARPRAYAIGGLVGDVTICATIAGGVLFGLRSRFGLAVRRLRSRGKGRCTGCGYDLRGLTRGICPECGRAIILPLSNEGGTFES